MGKSLQHWPVKKTELPLKDLKAREFLTKIKGGKCVNWFIQQMIIAERLLLATN